MNGVYSERSRTGVKSLFSFPAISARSVSFASNPFSLFLYITLHHYFISSLPGPCFRERRTTSGAVCGTGGGNVARRTQDGHFAARRPCDFEPAADDSRHAPAAHGHPVCGFQPAQPRTANCQRGHARAISSLRQRLPQAETLRDPPGLIRRGELRDADLRLLAGDSVLFCTDGISDAFSRKEEQFGIERLQEL